MKALVIANTLKMTKEEWLENRKKGIGGSDAAAIAGLNPWRSPIAVWLDKTGQNPPIDENERMYWGNRLEEIVADEFTIRTGKKLRRCNQILRHPEHTFMLANVDRLVVGEEAGCEIKTTGQFNAKNWSTEDFPPQYYLQCQHYMAVTDLPLWYMAILIGGQEFRWWTVERNEETVQNLIKIETDFWKLVETNTMPEPDGSEATSEILKKIYPESNGASIDLPLDAQEWARKRLEVSGRIKELEQEKLEAENRLKAMLEGNEVGWAGAYKIIWKASMRKGYTKTIEPGITRRFEIKEVAA